MLDTEFVQSGESGSKWSIVVLHGLGDSAAGYRWFPEMMRLPWLNFLLVNAPEPYFEGFSWYDFAGNPGPGIADSRERLFGLLDKMEADGFPNGRRFLFGFSQGCLMTLDVGARYPRKFAGLIGVSGYCHEPDSLIAESSGVAREQRFLLTHGTQDPLIPIEEVRGQIQTLKGAGFQIEWTEFDKAHTIAGETELSLIRDFLDARRREIGEKEGMQV